MASVLPSDITFYGSASMPDTDGATTGGAFDTTKKITFDDLLANGLCDYVSSSASDTAAVLTTSGRDATGVIVTEAKTLTGTTLVNGSQTFERLLKGVASGTTAVGDVAILSHTKVITAHTAVAGAAASSTASASITLASGDGASVALGQIIRLTNNTPSGVQFALRTIVAISGDIVSVNRDWTTVPSSATTYDVHIGMLFDLGPNQVTQVRRPFYNAVSDVSGGSTNVYYEKCFAVNNNTGTALTVSSLIKQTDPSVGTLQISLCNALNDTSTITTRINPGSPPASNTAYTSGSAPQTISVPSPANLVSGAAPNAAGAQGIWMQYTLAAGTAASKSSFTLRATGQTT